MKASIAIALACFIAACPAPKHPIPPEENLHSDEEVRDACVLASKRLAELKCREARVDFEAFCRDRIANDVPIYPICLSKISKCEEVDDCR